MKNPLRKRLLRELRSDFGKYAVIFLFMVMLVSLVSGFLVADHSIKFAYDEGFTKYNLEYGHFSFDKRPSDELLDRIEKETAIKLTDLSYVEEEYQDTKNIRIYKDRTDVNLACVMSGTMPEKDNEIALDRMFAQNSDLKVGDSISLNGKDLKVTALIALPDYSCLYESNSDMMFDAVTFGVAVMTADGYKALDSHHETANYAWLYDQIPSDDDEEKAMSDDLVDDLSDIIKDYDKKKIADREDELSKKTDKLQDEMNDISSDMFSGDEDEYMTQMAHIMGEFMEIEEEGIDESDIVTINSYVPRYANQAIQFTGEDMGSDKIMFTIFDYIVTAILAFVFAITISNTIAQESGVIGTLRASGYTRGELLRHYMVLPVAVTLVAAVIGNILGYSCLKQYMINMYYNSYSLCTYKTLWNGEAFIDTTVIPIIIMFVVNLFVLRSKLKLSPLKFLRHDLSKKTKKRAFPLSSLIPFFHRFRIRILFQNVSAYLVLFAGIFFAGAIAVFGTMFGPLLTDYAKLVTSSEIARYQYIVREDTKSKQEGIEKYCEDSLEYSREPFKTDDVMIYGIEPDSQYIKEEIPEGEALINNGMMEKYGISVGDTITLNDPYSTDTYSFVVAGEYKYDAAMSVFINRDEFNDIFDEDDDYYTGYFSNEEITDIDDEDIVSVITESDLKKIATQMEVSMGSFMGLMQVFAVIMFILLMYLLTKQIIEKNSNAISMVKILGFGRMEIGRLYLVITSFVVIGSLLISIPLINLLMRWIFGYYMYTEISGYIPYIIDNMCYVKMFLLGILSYLIVCIGLLRKIGKIAMSDALKNVE